MIYRWHAATSNHDEAWIKDFMKLVFGPDVDPSKHFLVQSLGAEDIKIFPKWPAYWK